MGHGHSHAGHGHSHAPANYDAAFAIGISLNIVYVAAEAAFGFWAGSLALLADAGHNLSDVLGLVLAWGAAYVARFPPTERHTYGWRSSTILAALANALILLVAVGMILWEAIGRFREPEPVAGTALIWVAGVGVVINTATALLFFGGRKGDLNIRGAFLHMAADAGISLGVVLAGVAILKTGMYWIDPAVSVLVAVLIFVSTWGLFRESIEMAMHAVPRGIDLDDVRAHLRGLPGIEGVHDLHVWPMSTTETALTAHLVKPDPAGDDELLARACRELHDEFGIEHMTIQFERSAEAHACRQAKPGAV